MFALLQGTLNSPGALSLGDFAQGKVGARWPPVTNVGGDERLSVKFYRNYQNSSILILVIIDKFRYNSSQTNFTFSIHKQ